MTSRILGVVREQVLAYYFGASSAMDAYNVAYRFPNLLRDLFAEGAMSAAFVPTFTKELATRGTAAAFRLANYVINALLVITGVAVVLGMLFAEPLVRAFAGGFEDVPGKLALTVSLTRIMLPFLTFVALAAAFMGMANALRHFFVPAVSPAMFNVSSIVCTIGLMAVDADVRPAAHHRRRDRRSGRRLRAVGRAVAAAPPRGLPLSPAARLARSGAAPRPAADGAGHDWDWPPRRSTCSSTPSSPPARKKAPCRG